MAIKLSFYVSIDSFQAWLILVCLITKISYSKSVYHADEGLSYLAQYIEDAHEQYPLFTPIQLQIFTYKTLQMIAMV